MGFAFGAVDIDIQFSGMRPGEKLYEEMFFSNEHALTTDHPKVLRAKLPALEDADERICALIEAAEAGAGEAELRERLTLLVPDFMPMDYERITPVEPMAVVVPSNGVVPPIAIELAASNGHAPHTNGAAATDVARRPSRPEQPVIVP